jgi:hypothetical protein
METYNILPRHSWRGKEFPKLLRALAQEKVDFFVPLLEAMASFQ